MGQIWKDGHYGSIQDSVNILDIFSHITFDCTYTTISTTTTINNINNTKTIKTTTNIAMFLVISETYNW